MKRIVFIFIVIVICQSNAIAYDFSAVAPSGQTLYYNIVNGKAQVTYPSFWTHPWNGYTMPIGNLTIPDSVSYNNQNYAVTTIDGYTFEGCGLSTVIIPNTVKEIGGYALSGCTSLTSISISNSVTSIGTFAFDGCTGLTSITIPHSVTSIGRFAFRSCTGITTLNFDADSIATLNPYTTFNNNYHPFSGCTNIVTLNIGNNVKIIPAFICYGFSQLTNVTIGDSVSNIGQDAFTGCSGLISVNYTGTISHWCSIDFGNSNPVQYSHNLSINGVPITNLTIPMGVAEINPNAFKGCNLNSVTIGNSVTTIGEYAFNGCTGLNTITIGNSVTMIDEHAFSGCNELSSIVMRCYPPTIHSNTFSSSLPVNIPIHVPCGAVSSYMSAANWSNFTHFVEDCATITVTANDFTLGGVTGGGTFTVGDTVTLTAIPYFGSRFIGWSNGSQENPLTFVATTTQNFVAAFGVGELPHDTVYVHDTTYITQIVRDTTYINNYIHDTTYINNYVHDTLIAYVNQYVHDTTFITNYIHDTSYIYRTQYDTLFVYNTVHDTAWLTAYVHDTAFVNNYIHDTVWLTQTVWEYIHDTVIEHVHHYIHDTTFINNYIHDTTYLTQYVDRYIHDTVMQYVNQTLLI